MSPWLDVWSVVSDGNGFLPVQFDRQLTWISTGEDKRFADRLRYLDRKDTVFGLVPRRSRHLDDVDRGRCVWASVENAVSGRSLDAFRPLPTLMFEKGRRRVAVWWMSEPVPMAWQERANKRLAFALKSNSKHAEPEWLCPVLPLVVAEPRMYGLREVVGRLKDAPARAIPSRT